MFEATQTSTIWDDHPGKERVNRTEARRRLPEHPSLTWVPQSGHALTGLTCCAWHTKQRNPDIISSGGSSSTGAATTGATEAVGEPPPEPSTAAPLA